MRARRRIAFRPQPRENVETSSDSGTAPGAFVALPPKRDSGALRLAAQVMPELMA
jgi:hypothetical protein